MCIQTIQNNTQYTSIMAPRKVKSCKSGRMVKIGGAAHKAHLEWMRAGKKCKGSKSKSTPKSGSSPTYTFSSKAYHEMTPGNPKYVPVGGGKAGQVYNPKTRRWVKKGGPTHLAMKQAPKRKTKTSRGRAPSSLF
jgi:hypothetical protein